MQVQKNIICENDYIWNPAGYSSRNVKSCDEIIDEKKKIVLKIFNEKKQPVKQKNYIFYLSSY